MISLGKKSVNIIKNFILKYKYQLIIFWLIVIVKSIFNLRIVTVCGISGADEIGTIASAAYFAGYDWSNVISHTLYYGFGYSAFMTPVFLLFDNVIVIHQVLLLYNTVMFALSAVVCFNILTKYLKINNNLLACIISLASILFMPSFMNSNSIINESALTFINWIMIYLLLYVCKNNSKITRMITTLVISLLFSYSLFIHTRSLMFFGVIFCVVIGYYVFTKKALLNVPVFIICSGFGYVASHYIIKMMQNKLWLVVENDKLGNSTSFLVGSLTNIKQIFSSHGIKAFIKTIFGQVYAMFTTTYGVVTLFLAIVTVYIIHYLKKYKKKQRVIFKTQKQRAILIILIYCSVSIISTILLVATVALNTTIASEKVGSACKWYLYTRYWSIYIGPMIMISLYYLYSQRFVNKAVVKRAEIMFIAFALFFVLFIGSKFEGVAASSSGIFYMFGSLGGKKYDDVFSNTYFLKFTILFSTISLIIIALIYFRKIREAAVALVILFSINYGVETVNFQQYIAVNVYDQYEDVINIVRDTKEYSSKIYVNSDMDTINKLNTQFSFPKYKVMNEREFEENSFLITNRLGIDLVGQGSYIVYEKHDGFVSEDMWVIARGQKLCEELREKGYELKEIPAFNYSGEDLFFANSIAELDYTVKGVTTLDNGQVQYGPCVTVNEGEYVVTITGSNLTQCSFDTILLIDQNIMLGEIEITNLSDNEVSYILNVPGDASSCELRTFCTGEAQTTIDNINITFR